MGTYYSQLARGFLIPSSQPVTASKTREPDQKCLQMLYHVAETVLVYWHGTGFSITQWGGILPKLSKYEKLSVLRTNICECTFSDLEMRWLISSCEQMFKAMGSVERSCCLSLRPCSGGFNHTVDLYHAPAACWVSLETQHSMLYSSPHSTPRVVFTLGALVWN